MDFTPAINSFMQGGLQGWQLAQEKKRNDALLAKGKADLSGQGFNEDGTIDEGFLDENNPSYKRAMQMARIKAMASAKAAPTSNPLSFKQVFAARGIPLPKELEANADSPFDHRYASILAPLQRQGEQIDPSLVRDPDGFIKNNPGVKVPVGVASAIKPLVPRPGSTPMTPEQQAQYEQMMGLPAGTARGMTVGQFASGTSNVRGQEAAAGRQATALGAAARRQAESLGQQGQQFAQKMDYDREKDLQTRLERFRDDYAKTGVPKARSAFEKLDKLTGVLSSDKPNLKKLPGYGTNTLRSIPLVGQGLSTMAAKTYGGEEEAQLLQALLNADIQSTSGQAVTRYEEGRNLVKAGVGPGGNEQDVARGIRIMYDALEGADRDARAAYPPEVIALYEARGGSQRLNPSQQRAREASARKFGMGQGVQDMIMNPTDPSARAAAQKELGKGKGAAPKKPMSFEEWKKAGKPKAGG